MKDVIKTLEKILKARKKATEDISKRDLKLIGIEHWDNDVKALTHAIKVLKRIEVGEIEKIVIENRIKWQRFKEGNFKKGKEPDSLATAISNAMRKEIK